MVLSRERPWEEAIMLDLMLSDKKLVKQRTLGGQTEGRKSKCKDSEIGQVLHTGVQKAGHKTELTGWDVGWRGAGTRSHKANNWGTSWLNNVCDIAHVSRDLSISIQNFITQHMLSLEQNHHTFSLYISHQICAPGGTRYGKICLGTRQRDWSRNMSLS